MKYLKEYSSYENNLLNKVHAKPEVFIAFLLKDLKIKYFNEYPQSMFFTKSSDGEIVMEYDIEKDTLFISYESVWAIVEGVFAKIAYQKIIELIKYVVETGFKINVGMVTPVKSLRYRKWKSL